MLSRFLFAAVVVAGLATVSSAFAPAPVYREPPRPKVPPLSQALQGTWQLQQNQMVGGFGGRRLGARIPRTTSIRIEGSTWTYVYAINGAPRDSTKYEMALDPKQNPATLDLKYLAQIQAGGSQVAMKGIVKVEGDTLTFCYVSGYQQNAVRPTTFTPGVLPNGTVPMTMTLKKVK